MGAKKSNDQTFLKNIAITDIDDWAFVAGSAGDIDTIGFQAIDTAGKLSPSAAVTLTAENDLYTATSYDFFIDDSFVIDWIGIPDTV